MKTSEFDFNKLVSGFQIVVGAGVIIAIVFNVCLRPISVYVNTKPVYGKVTTTLEKVSKGEINYLVYIQNPNEKNQTVYEIENKALLARFDRSSVYGDLKASKDEGKCVQATSYGVRIPTISFPGLKDIDIVDCK